MPTTTLKPSVAFAEEENHVVAHTLRRSLDRSATMSGLVDPVMTGAMTAESFGSGDGTFTDGCYLEAVSTENPDEIRDLPEDAEFDAYIAPDIPW